MPEKPRASKRSGSAKREPKAATRRPASTPVAAVAPPPLPRLHGTRLGTGLVDYAMWVEMFSGQSPEPPPEPYRRGRIWA